MIATEHTTEPTVFTVTQLNSMVREVLEECFATVYIDGEISNLSTPSSGHVYFTLKDDNAQVRCAMFRQYHRMMNTKLEAGMQVRVRARVSLYEGRGDYQLIVHECEEIGDGQLQKAFEQLKNKLSREGLFNSEHKKAIPKLPQRIGVITSSTGAALHDILSVLKRRFASIPVVVYPSQVQGAQAAGQLVRAIEIANQRNECDVLLLARGGGSLEDLWPFNEEVVARAIFNSQLPIVSGVGHEVDITISDFVADARAATPTAAAELVSPDVHDLLHKFTLLSQRLTQTIQTILRHATLELQHLAKRIRHPGHRLQEQHQQLDQLEQRLQQAFRVQLMNKNNQLTTLMRALHAVSPLNTLNRGYAIATQDHKVLTQSNQTKVGDQIQIRLYNGELTCTVDKII